MKYFTEIPEGQAIVCVGGLYRQSQLAVRDGRIYVKHGSGYVRLHNGGGTSLPKMKWYEIDTPEGEWSEKDMGVYYEGGE